MQHLQSRLALPSIGLGPDGKEPLPIPWTLFTLVNFPVDKPNWLVFSGRGLDPMFPAGRVHVQPPSLCFACWGSSRGQICSDGSRCMVRRVPRTMQNPPASRTGTTWVLGLGKGRAPTTYRAKNDLLGQDGEVLGMILAPTY